MASRYFSSDEFDFRIIRSYEKHFGARRLRCVGFGSRIRNARIWLVGSGICKPVNRRLEQPVDRLTEGRVKHNCDGMCGDPLQDVEEQRNPAERYEEVSKCRAR